MPKLSAYIREDLHNRTFLELRYVKLMMIAQTLGRKWAGLGFTHLNSQFKDVLKPFEKVLLGLHLAFRVQSYEVGRLFSF